MEKMRRRITGALIFILSAAVLTACGKGAEEETEEYEESVVLEEELQAEKEEMIQEEEYDGITVCIDPGHYGDVNKVEFEDDSGTDYCEAETNLAIALKLRDILEEEYGIRTVMTRQTKDIIIGDYVNQYLDEGHISERGVMAEGCDLFISIHTNANLEDANDCETAMQPLSINKTLVIVNFAGLEDETVMTIANNVGTNVTNVNKEHGLVSLDFVNNMNGSDVLEWTDEYNDGLDEAGTICKRTGSNGDYYGVLRGASSVGVPGFIVEHAYHSVEEVRETVVSTDIIDEWARADATAIAEGFGIEPLE